METLKSLDGNSARRYWIMTRRSLIAMVSRRTLRRVNGSANHYFVRPFVVMAARALGPGPTRLKLVKLAHNLGSRPAPAEAVELAYVEEPVAEARRTKRAA